MGLVSSLHENIENLYSLIERSYRISFLLLVSWQSLAFIHSYPIILFRSTSWDNGLQEAEVGIPHVAMESGEPGNPSCN